MSLIDLGPKNKRCLTYCGDDVCDCDANPRYSLDEIMPQPGETCGGPARNRLDELMQGWEITCTNCGKTFRDFTDHTLCRECADAGKTENAGD